MQKQHHFSAIVTWTGNKGTGTSTYTAYDRDHVIAIEGKPDLLGSSDAAFRGNPSRHNPEDSFVGAIAACHMLWYLHLCAVNDVVVVSYTDKASGIMNENVDGSGQFKEVILFPEVKVANSSMLEKANALHTDAHSMCFLARSVNFPVSHQPKTLVA